MVEVNKIYGNLKTIECVDNTNSPSLHKWLCICECGNKHVARVQHLLTGHVTRCKACARKSRSETLLKTHSNSPKYGNTKHPLYHVWQSMIQRCVNEAAKDYNHYGARGIKVCSEWRSSFRKYLNYIETKLGPKPSAKHSIDRIDNNGDYKPDNIRWATHSEQQRNKQIHYV